MTIGTRFTLGHFYSAGLNTRAYVCGIEHREKTVNSSRVLSREVVRTMPDFKTAETWCAEWNRLEAQRLINDMHAEALSK